jgi:hypothetical protein
MQTSLRVRYDFGTTEGIGSLVEGPAVPTQAYLVAYLATIEPDEPRDPPDVVAEPSLESDLARKRR